MFAKHKQEYEKNNNGLNGNNSCNFCTGAEQ